MTHFDFKKYLAEGKLHEAMFDISTTEKIAQHVADAFTAEDNELDLKYVVTPGTGQNSFDLDVEAGPNTPGEDWKDANGFGIDNYLGQYAGGSFYIKDGVVYNAASRNAPVAKVSPEGEVEMISAEESRAAIDMEEARVGKFMSGAPEEFLDDEFEKIEYEDYEDENEYDEIDAQRKRETQMANVFVREENKSNKMKKSELKEMIKAAMLAEMEVEETEVMEANKETFDQAFDRIDKSKEVYQGSDKDSVKEADEEVDAEETTDVAVDDTETIDTETTAEVNPNVKAVQDSLTQAMEAAKSLGDKKLESQIGNTITFFTRSHVAGTESGTMAEADEMEEGKKEYYKDAEADDAEHIKALEKDMADDKEDSMKIGEVLFPMWTKMNKK